MSLYQTPSFRLLLSYIALILLIASCSKDQPSPLLPIEVDYGYKASIETPTVNSVYNVGDTIPIQINFQSLTGEIIHYLSVDIYDQNNLQRSLYSVEAHQHVPDSFYYFDQMLLNDSSKIVGVEEWRLEASMWSHEKDPDTISSFVDFRILNN